MSARETMVQKCPKQLQTLQRVTVWKLQILLDFRRTLGQLHHLSAFWSSETDLKSGAGPNPQLRTLKVGGLVKCQATPKNLFIYSIKFFSLYELYENLGATTLWDLTTKFERQRPSSVCLDMDFLGPISIGSSLIF